MESTLKTNQEGASIDPDFAKTIEESKAIIHEEAQKKVRKGRSDRGKPRTKDPAQVNGASVSPQPNQAINTQGPNQQTDLSPYLITPIQALSTLPAKKHNIPELSLTSEEAKACAEALNNCFNVFVPNMNQMSPKTAAVMGAFMVFGSIGFTKYQIYSEVMEKRYLEQNRPGNDKEKIEPEIKLNNEAKIPADSYFKR